MAQLPPLSAIRAFEAAARHGSFTKAAEELGMTQAAISYQVKLLEDRVGLPLFLRQARKVELSEAGRKLAPAVADAFQRLSAAFAGLRESDANLLSLTVVSTFCTNWLVPRLGGFQMAHPQIAVRLDASWRTYDLRETEFDIAIRGGKGVWPGLKAHRLFPMEMVPMCSPDFLKRYGPIRDAAALLKLPLLDWQDNCWRDWFAHVGIADPVYEGGPAMAAQTQQMLGVAAMAGQGVALLTPEFFPEELADGRLVLAHQALHRTEQSYWLAYREDRARSPKIRAFRDWILAELASESDPAHKPKGKIAGM
jgi:LysR family glycine cleavage system transcriptional activator